MPSKIKVIKGDICKIKENALIVHGVNCQGVMASGVALALRKEYPEIYKSYSAKVSDVGISGLLLGQVDYVEIDEDLHIANAFTQYTYGRIPGKRYVDYEAVQIAFEDINKYLTQCTFGDNVLRLYFPAIGAGLGGGNWNTIETIISNTVDQKFDPTLVLLPTVA